jgi:hypothetical protein
MPLDTEISVFSKDRAQSGFKNDVEPIIVQNCDGINTENREPEAKLNIIPIRSKKKPYQRIVYFLSENGYGLKG